MIRIQPVTPPDSVFHTHLLRVQVVMKLSYRRQTTRRFLCKCNGMADLLKPRPFPYVLPRRIRSFYIKGYRHEYRRTTKIGKHWNSALLRREAWLPQDTPFSHMYYHVKFGSSATKGVRINRKEPPKLGSAGTPSLRGGCQADESKTRSPLPIYVTT